MRIPILTYHAQNIGGNDYGNNDHVAFASDLETINALGWTVTPLIDCVQHFLNNTECAKKTIAITFDDGADFDVHDLLHPTAGSQRSMLNIMRDFQAKHPIAQPKLHATSFVIASRDARTILDKTCMIGAQWWNDEWWQASVESGMMGIANHSWDHCHDTLPVVAQRNQAKGNFWCIDTFEDAEAQIRNAANHILSLAPNPSAMLFAYPYGHANEYLVNDYLPKQAQHIQTLCSTAAFGTKPKPLTHDSNRWDLPRYMCGQDWKSPEQLQLILSDAL
jgi:hypothetical protein